jgi:hypothetical protein
MRRRRLAREVEEAQEQPAVTAAARPPISGPTLRTDGQRAHREPAAAAAFSEVFRAFALRRARVGE